MHRLRIATSIVAIALPLTACVPPGAEGAARPELEQEPLTRLPEVTAPPPTTTSTSTTTSLAPPATVGVPVGPLLDVGQTVCDLYPGPVRELGTIASELVVEASGIAASRVNPDTYWVVNDSGHEPILHGVAADGSEAAALPLRGVLGLDWEDIAVGPGPVAGTSYVYIGDIGDNLRLRTSINLLRFPEPNLDSPVSEIDDITTIRLTYPVATEDSEAFWVDPITGDVLVVTKRQEDGRSVAFRADASNLDGTAPAEMMQVAEFEFGAGAQVTAADVTTDGAVVALRGYNEVWMWLRTDLGYVATLAAKPCAGLSPEEVQGEALAFLPGELSYVTLSEGKAKPLNLVRASG